jgi:hypothetical protein
MHEEAAGTDRRQKRLRQGHPVLVCDLLQRRSAQSGTQGRQGLFKRCERRREPVVGLHGIPVGLVLKQRDGQGLGCQFAEQ